MSNTRRHRTFAMIALCLGALMVILDVMIVNVALPIIEIFFHGSGAWSQWIIAAYLVTFSTLLLSVGNIIDRLGAKPAYFIGALLFTASSLGCAFAPDLLALTLSRALQGVAAALTMPASLALVRATYDDARERMSAISFWISMSGVGIAAGAFLGGVLTYYFGWRSIFLVNVPVGIVVLWLTAKYVVSVAPSEKKSFDFAGQLFACLCIGSLAFALIEAGNLGWESHWVIGSSAVFFLTGILFLWVEKTVKHPMLPLHFFEEKTLFICLSIGLLINACWFGEVFVLTFYFHHIRNYDALISGMAFLPFMGANWMAALISGKLMHKIGMRLPVVIGCVLSIVGFFVLFQMRSHVPYFDLVLPLFAAGVGTALIMPSITSVVMHIIPAHYSGMASSTFNAARQIGSLIGVSLFGTLAFETHNFMHGMRNSLLLGGILLVVSLIFALQLKRSY